MSGGVVWSVESGKRGRTRLTGWPAAQPMGQVAHEKGTGQDDVDGWEWQDVVMEERKERPDQSTTTHHPYSHPRRLSAS